MTGKIEQWVRSAYYQGDDPGTAAKTIALLSAAAKWDAEIEALKQRLEDQHVAKSRWMEQAACAAVLLVRSADHLPGNFIPRAKQGVST